MRGHFGTTALPSSLTISLPTAPAFGPCLLWLPVNGWLDQVATWYGGIGLIPGYIVLDGGTQLPLSEKGTQQPPLFGPCLLWTNGRPSQQLLSSCAKWIHTAFFDHATYRYNQLAGGYIAEGQSFPFATSHRTALFRRLGFC